MSHDFSYLHFQVLCLLETEIVQFLVRRWLIGKMVFAKIGLEQSKSVRNAVVLDTEPWIYVRQGRT